jgi:hypothetical protein
MKYLVILLLISTPLFPQEDRGIGFYGEIGFGFSLSSFPLNATGVNSNLSISVLRDEWLLRLTRKVNGELSGTYPKDKIRSIGFLIGRSFPVYQEFGEKNELSLAWNVIFYSGIAVVENQENVTTYDDRYAYKHLTVTTGYGIPLELEFQYVLPKYRGAALNLFYNINGFRDVYGVSLSFVVGYF